MSDALIITSLSIVEAFSRHQALISQHQGVVSIPSIPSDYNQSHLSASVQES